MKRLKETMSKAKQAGDKVFTFLAQHQYMCVALPLERFEEAVAIFVGGEKISPTRRPFAIRTRS